jgi:hypothetical protein
MKGWNWLVGVLTKDLIYAALSGQVLSRIGDGYEQSNDVGARY